MKAILKEIFNSYGIHYKLRGNNVADGNINVKCPFCGSADPSEHMGINLENGYWGCWRNSSHSGKDLSYLISVLIGCTKQIARELLGQQSPTDLNDLQDKVSSLGKKTLIDMEESKVSFPGSFQPITKNKPYKIFWSYLLKRGFLEDDIPYIIDRYNLSGCIIGKYAYRIILPYYDKDKLIGWTGRAVGKSDLRYFSSGPEIKEVLYNEQNLPEKGLYVYIVEGPFDCLKIDMYGSPCVAISGLSITTVQAKKLRMLSKRFTEVRCLLDSGALSTAVKLSSIIPGIKILQLPEEFSDPGELPAEDITSILSTL